MLISAAIDTNVLISGLITNNKNSPTYKIVEEIYKGNIIPIYNVKIIKEYVDVLYREKFAIDEDDILDLIMMITRFGTEINPINSGIKFLDETDRKFYDVYNMIKNAYLITGNIKHFPREKYIMNPREFCGRILERI